MSKEREIIVFYAQGIKLKELLRYIRMFLYAESILIFYMQETVCLLSFYDQTDLDEIGLATFSKN